MPKQIAQITQLKQAKSALRNIMISERSAMADADLASRSAQIMERLTSLDEWQNIESVHTYIAAMTGEVDTIPLIELLLAQNIQVIVPIVASNTRTLIHARLTSMDQLARTNGGLLEPRPEGREMWQGRSVDIVVVPGLAFAGIGDRLGMGGGYYDRFLPRIEASKIAVAFDSQIVNSVPTGETDVQVSIIVTESNTFRN